MFEARQIVAAAQQVQPAWSSTAPTAAPASRREAVQQMRDGADRRRLHGARPLLQVARHHRPQAASSRCPPACTTTCGSARRRSTQFTQNRFHYNWHWFWDYGNGDIGNQGIHQMDMARWGLGVKYPTKVSAIGGHFMFDDDQETPNTLTATFEFDDDGKKKMMVFEVRHWMTNHEAGIGEGGRAPNTVGTIFYGSNGYLAIWDEDHGRYQSFLGRSSSPGPPGRTSGTIGPTSSRRCAAASTRT